MTKQKCPFRILRIGILNLFVIWSLVLGISPAFASETNGAIVGGGNNGHAWSDQAGWINFGCANCGISIADSGITGHAWSNNYGWINMSPTNGGVAVDANGALSGYAWGSGAGWINFFGVSINSSGKFVGQATGTIIGTLTFDCANCSVTTEFRPASVRSSVGQAASVAGAGGAGGIPFVSGPGGQSVPAYLSVFNAPMKLFPAQSGILTQNLSNQKRVELGVPTNIFSDEVTFIVAEEAVSTAPAAEIQVIGNAVFNVFAVDKNNNRVRIFEKPIKITFIVPESLRGRSDLAVYFFDETAQVWVKIPDAVFSGDAVSFSVDHLTLFAIFAGPELSPAIKAPFQLPLQFQFEIPRIEVEPPREGIGVPAEEAAPAEIASEEKPPLFDIEVSPGPSESKRTRVFVLIAVLIIAAGGATFYFLRKRKNQQ